MVVGLADGRSSCMENAACLAECTDRSHVILSELACPPRASRVSCVLTATLCTPVARSARSMLMAEGQWKRTVAHDNFECHAQGHAYTVTCVLPYSCLPWHGRLGKLMSRLILRRLDRCVSTPICANFRRGEGSDTRY